MLLGLLAAVLVAPLYWVLAPSAWRREVLSLASLAALALWEVRLALLLVIVTTSLFGLMNGARARKGSAAFVMAGLTALAALFVFNKVGARGLAVLPSQTGLHFLGVSYLVLKAAAALIETARGSIRDVRYREVLAWIVFLPTYPAGPMEDLDHFRGQVPEIDRGRVLGGLERILFGLLKALVAAHYLGEWATPVFAAPDQYGSGPLLLALYAFALCFYLDFSGYSDIAIGLAALYGYDIAENFDHPFLRRNLVQLWQCWHITLTRWLRAYLFVPVTRSLLRRSRTRRQERCAVAAGQVAAMTFCGLWHGLSPNFAFWGLLQALGLIWVGVIARDLGNLLPTVLVRWWRTSPIARVASTALTFNFFAVSIVFVVTDTASAARYLFLLFGAS